MTQDGVVVSSSTILVSGKVTNNANVSANGNQASITNDSFSVSILLSEGSNTIQVTATDQYSQAASQKISVLLATNGSIMGVITDYSTKAPLDLATVSVTDSLSLKEGAVSNCHGEYMVGAIAPGAFNGKVTQSGYTSYDFSGTMSPRQTMVINAALSPILPIISNIAVSGLTTNSATITWTTDQMAQSVVEYGPTTSYGNSAEDSTLTTNHTLVLSNLTAGTTYHFKATSKNGYGFLSSSSDLTFTTLAPVIISNIAALGITSGSATIKWVTDQAADSLVDYGPTSAYGAWVKDSALTTDHAILLNNLAMATTYHFRVTSTNGVGSSSSSGDNTFSTSGPAVNAFIITFPKAGDTIFGSSTCVKGTVGCEPGNERGVVVNGMLANVYGNEFVVNHIPLVEGSNTITATVTDMSGHREAVAVAVNAVSAGDYIKITANVNSGLSPLETTLAVESSLPLTSALLAYTGSGEVEFLSTSVNEYKIRISIEGIYYFTVRVSDSSGKLYEDTVAITVLSRTEIGDLLRSRWDGMRAKLASFDIEGALGFFDADARENYRKLFNVLSTILPTIAQDMSNIQLIEHMPNAVIYDIQTTREGVTYSYQLLFTQGVDGLWRINSF